MGYLNLWLLSIQLNPTMIRFNLIWMIFMGANFSRGVVLKEPSILPELFQDPYCISLIQDESQATPIQTLSNKVTRANLNFMDGHKGRFCKAVFVSLDLEAFLQSLANQSSLFHKDNAQFIMTVQNRSWRNLLCGSNFFDKILHLAVLDLADGSFYTKSLCGSSPFIKIGVYDGNHVILDGSTVFQKFPDISCQSVRATAFHYAPFTIVSEDEQGQRSYSGLEVEIFQTTAQKLGFSYVIEPPTDGEMWGRFTPPNHFSGLIGDLQYERSDIGWADLYPRLYEKTGLIDFTDAYDVDYFCFYVMKPKPLPKWMALGLPLQMWTWVAALGTMVAALIFMYFYGFWSHLESNNHGTRTFFLIGAMVDESLPEIIMIKSHAGRLFLAIFLLCFFVLTIGYRGGLVANLSIPQVPRPIDTIAEVVNDPRPVISFGENFRDDLSKSDDPITRQILENYNFHYDFDGAFKNLSQGNVIMAESLQNTLYKIRSQFTNNFGETTIHTMSECLTPYRVAFAVQKNSIYKRPISRVIQKLKEGGFINKWLNDEMDLVARIQTKASVLSRTEATPMTLDEFQAAYLVYLCFIALSLVGFCLELVFSKMAKMTAMDLNTSFETL